MDLVAFAPHPDDAELACGGLLLKMAAQGYSTAVVDLTRGEMGSRGDPDTRAQEAAKAAKLLGLTERLNLALPDGGLQSNGPARLAVAKAVRQLRPRIVLLPYWEERHPDHIAASQLIYDGVHLAGLRRYEAPGKPYRVRQLMYYAGRVEFVPSVVIDISEQFARKLEAVKTYRSQLHRPGQEAPKTDIGAADFLRRWEARQIVAGGHIGAAYGEPYRLTEPIALDDPIAQFAGPRPKGESS